MAGKGKTGKHASKEKSKHTSHRTVLKDGHVTNGAIRRLARRGGCKRLSFAAHHHIREYVDDFLERVVRDCLTFSEHRHAKTITALDVVYALKKNGRTIYGYGA